MQNRISRYALYAVVALAAFAAGVWINVTRQPDTPERSAASALFALDLPDLQGRKQSLRQWRGKVLVVNFWATWCAPCREEIPIFVKMQDLFASNGVQFVGISIDQADKTLEFATTFKINYPTLIGTFDTVEVSRQAGNNRRVLPYTLFVNRAGEIIAAERGGITEDKLQSLLKSLL